MSLILSSNCTDCSLSETRTNIVWGDGPEDAEILFCAEAPGFNEDQTGIPLYHKAKAGSEFNYILARHGIQRYEVYVTNTVRCHPLGNKNPTSAQLQACAKWLDMEIEIVNPKFIVALGYFATQHFIPGATLEAVHGIPFQIGERVIIPVFHIASGFHDSSRMLHIQLDFRAIAEIVKGNLPTRHIADEYAGKEEYYVLTDGDL